MTPPPDAPIDGRARAYHAATTHSPASVRADAHTLDWRTRPAPFKLYRDVPLVPLPRDLAFPTRSAVAAVAAGAAEERSRELDLPTLAQCLYLGAGLTKKKVYPGGETFHFRAAASTGALYEVEAYLVAGAVPGLEPGVYHFRPLDFALARLRAGDLRGALADAASDPARVATAPATLVLSALYWRNTWKYQARAYRHFFWNAGTLLANLLATAAAADLPARVLLGFADGAVNHLLGLDPTHEGSLALVPLGTGAAAPPPAPSLPRLALAVEPLSPREVDYPLVRAAYAASALASGADARAWPGVLPARRPPSAGTPLAPPSAPPGAPLGDVILRRGSTRQFAREPVGFADLSVMLDAAVRDLPLDAGGPLVDAYLLVHAVDGLPAGAYAYEPAARALRPLRSGDFRSAGGYLCLEQSLGADASAVVFFLADLEAVLARFGDRGYRAVNLAAGLLGGRMYLCAYALGLGATGLTFYDDDVARFFAPDAATKDAIFVTALGRAFRPPRRGGLRPIDGTLQRLSPGER